MSHVMERKTVGQCVEHKCGDNGQKEGSWSVSVADVIGRELSVNVFTPCREVDSLALCLSGLRRVDDQNWRRYGNI